MRKKVWGKVREARVVVRQEVACLGEQRESRCISVHHLYTTNVLFMAHRRFEFARLCLSLFICSYVIMDLFEREHRLI